ncbi:Cytochrome c oxidase copper chaperone [Rhynchospora pubera]|uniref:Cytochrome c oxidase copper chaperone n=1 Tax=Rhynchospora pubera TaxID=906938 RepID=A0AAV8C7B3_9POAL|nr:Cytochrome c oxidase copper chaperone [Rhynchospora pubera]
MICIWLYLHSIRNLSSGQRTVGWMRKILSHITSRISATKAENNKQVEHGEAACSADAELNKKICSACPVAKRLKEECIVEHGEAACTKWIEAHKRCLRTVGVNV